MNSVLIIILQSNFHFLYRNKTLNLGLPWEVTSAARINLTIGSNTWNSSTITKKCFKITRIRSHLSTKTKISITYKQWLDKWLDSKPMTMNSGTISTLCKFQANPKLIMQNKAKTNILHIRIKNKLKNRILMTIKIPWIYRRGTIQSSRCHHR